MADSLFDVVILGGGIAGLCVARHLLRLSPPSGARPTLCASGALRIGLVDPGPLPADATRSKVGESSTEASSWYLGERLGLAAHLEACQVKKLGLRFFLPGPRDGAFADRPEFGVMTPGPRTFAVPFAGLDPVTWQLHRGRLEASLFADLADPAAGVTFRPATRSVVRLGQPHRVDLDGPAGIETWRARWVIDASGRGLAVPSSPDEDRALGHHAQAAWFWAPHRIDPDAFSSDPTFASRIPKDLRWRSTNHLVGQGYWVWIIALADGTTSIGVVSDPAQHPPEQFTHEGGCRAWIARHEPELSAALRGHDAPWAGYARRVWESHARRTLVSSERWAVTGDTAAFLDPLFSSGLDFITIGNELLVPQVLADLAGHDIGREARRASSLFARMVEQYLHLYQGSYVVMGHPRAMMAKIVWDLATYLGFLAPIVRSGRLADEAFMARVGFVGQGVATLQARVSAVLVGWATAKARSATSPDATPGRSSSPCVDHACTPLAALVLRLREARHGDVLELVQANLGLLEQLAVAVFRRACEDIGLDAPDGPLNPYGVGLDPSAWAADGLTGGARPVGVEPWVARAMERVWLPS